MEPKSAGEYVAVARDVLIVSAVWIYFVGFVYVYYYLRAFSVSSLSMAAAPQSVLVYAYNVLGANKLLSVAIGILGVVAIYGFVKLQKWVIAQKEPESGAQCGSTRSFTNPDIVQLVMLLTAGLLFALLFWGGFQTAHLAADRDVKRVHTLVDSSAADPVRIVELQSGPLVHGTKAFDDAIDSINQAGSLGKAYEVAQADGQIYLVVATSDNVDTVYSIPKDGIMVQTSHAKSVSQ